MQHHASPEASQPIAPVETGNVDRPDIFLITMPGFGVETLKRLHADARWSRQRVHVCAIGSQSAWAKGVAARLRLWLISPPHRLAAAADSTLASRDAQRWFAGNRYLVSWVETDDAVAALRRHVGPSLTITIGSRVIFSQETLANPGTEWWNVHPGLLPMYAGASPCPYMFLDGRAGCSIHRMAARVDAGPLLDRAELSGDLGRDGGELYFERLPALAAERLLEMLDQWRSGTIKTQPQDPRELVHRSAARLRCDRVLRWHLPAERIQRWVLALMPYAPALVRGAAPGDLRVFQAEVVPNPAASAPGRVLARSGRSLTVACLDGALRLVCDRRPRVVQGQLLPDEVGTPS